MLLIRAALDCVDSSRHRYVEHIALKLVDRSGSLNMTFFAPSAVYMPDIGDVEDEHLAWEV
ncbi:hypothetical protein N7485_008186 [Penicillium canescens]|nr:hypothetical protein N7485_008186 [Penicillium canescens]